VCFVFLNSLQSDGVAAAAAFGLESGAGGDLSGSAEFDTTELDHRKTMDLKGGFVLFVFSLLVLQNLF
jgi:hypothetical protein